MVEYIEREAAIDCLNFVCVPQCRQYAQEEIKKLPAADVRPVAKARWEKVMDQSYFRKHYHVVSCSACHKRGNQGWNFCPNCGADMMAEPPKEE